MGGMVRVAPASFNNRSNLANGCGPCSPLHRVDYWWRRDSNRPAPVVAGIGPSMSIYEGRLGAARRDDYEDRECKPVQQVDSCLRSRDASMLTDSAAREPR